MITTVGLFAGIGGIEEGLRQVGFEPQLLCEIDSTASSVLHRWFPDVELVTDVRNLSKIPPVDLLCAGFPCQGLSQVGRAKGIHSGESRLVREVFRLVARDRSAPRWILLENVPFMMKLQGGRAMKYLTRCLDELGYAWAYRVVDTRAFGLPQRRKRVLILASKREDPRPVLLNEDSNPMEHEADPGAACGFYWTEGNNGLGWAVNAVPALKSGSTLSIPSPPAIWLPKTRSIVLPDIRDAERLQGFRPGWTDPKMCDVKFLHRTRWQLIGNAVSVPVARWVGRRLLNPGRYYNSLEMSHSNGGAWGIAGWGYRGEKRVLNLSDLPVHRKSRSLEEFLKFPMTNLSVRATGGFLGRARRSSLRFQPGFLEDVAHHLHRMKHFIQ